MVEGLRERLAGFQDEAEQIFVILEERDFPPGRLGRIQRRVRLLRGDLDDVIRDLSYLIGWEEAWEE